MKTGHRFLFIMLLLWIAAPINAQLKYSRVKIHIPPQGLAYLQSQGVDFDHGEVNDDDHTFITTLSETDLLHLKKTGTAFTILIDDEMKRFQQYSKVENFYAHSNAMMVDGKLHFQNGCASVVDNVPVPAAFIPGTYGGYYRLAEMQGRINAMLANYPDLVDTIVLPIRSHGNRPLVVVKISDNADTDENEPEALYTGLHHAREGMSMMNLFFYMQYLLENYNTDPRVKDLVDSRELFFLPCVNPDGYAFNESGPTGGMWRKNRRDNGPGFGRGVDLNRNYSVDWGRTAPNTSISFNPNDDSYIGPEEFSEPETRALKALSESRHFTIAIDHHAYGNYYVTPYGRPSAHTPIPTTDNNFYKYASALMGKYNGYFAGDGLATVNYYAVGNSRDWYISGDIGTGTKQKTYGYTVEVGSGSHGFWPDAEEIIPIARGMFFANMQMAYMAGSYFELQDLDKMSVNSPGGNFNFSLRRIGLTDAPVTVTIIPIENIQSVGSPVTINSMPNYFDVVTQSIPYTLPGSIAAGRRIRFVYEISSGGITLTDTVVKFYQPEELLFDDMESTTNWTFSPGSEWGTTTVAAYQGNRSLSESPTGNYNISEHSSATYKNAIDLTGATSAFLTFRVRHRAQNSYDKLQIQLSPNGTGSFQPVCGQSTVRENVGTLNEQPALTGIREVWIKETIDLRNYLGNNNVRLRFDFTSNGSKEDDGFYIDNVEIIKSTVSSSLGVKFINITVKRIQQGAQISWEAIADHNHDFFEVQRSTDGVHFTAIGTVRGLPPYQFTDPSPAAVSYYRIRAVDQQQHSDYSKTVVLKNTYDYTLTVAPNPAINVLFINFSLEEQTDFELTITDMTGRVHQTQLLHQARGSGYRTITVHNLLPQLYAVRLRNIKTGQESHFKIVKK